MYFVYVLLSKKDGKFYIGQTQDLTQRIRRHILGYVKSTKNRRPFELVYQEQFETRSEAMKKEKYLKSGAGHEYLRSAIDAARSTGYG